MTRMSVKIADDEDDCTQGIHDWYECENEGK